MKKILILLVFLISYNFANATQSKEAQHKDIALAKDCEPTIYETITTSGIFISNNPFRNLKIDNNGLNDDLKGTIYELPQGRADKQTLFKLGKFEMGTHDKIPKVWAYEITYINALDRRLFTHIDVDSSLGAFYNDISFYMDTRFFDYQKRMYVGLPDFAKNYLRIVTNANRDMYKNIDMYGDCKQDSKEALCNAIFTIPKNKGYQYELFIIIYTPIYVPESEKEGANRIHLGQDYILSGNIALHSITRVYVNVYDTKRQRVATKILASLPSVYNVKTKEKCEATTTLRDIITLTE